MEDQEKARRRKPLAAILIMLAVISISAAITPKLRGRPAILSGAAGGVLLVLGIVLLVKKD